MTGIKRRIMNIKVISAALILIIGVSCSQNQTDVSSDIEVPVEVENVNFQSIERTLSTTGTVYPVQKTELTSETAGKYYIATNPATGKPYKLGDLVQKGNTIIRIEDKEYENSIRIESQKLNLDNAQRDYEKQKSLYEKGGVTLSEISAAEVSYTNAQYDYENAQLQLNKLKVTAPFTGTIVELPYYTESTRVASGQPMVTLMNFANLFMEIQLPEKNLGTVEVGQKVKVTNYMLPDDTIHGSVSQLSPAIDEDRRTFAGIINIENKDRIFRPGMFVKADIVVERKDSVIVIPKEIVSSGSRGKSIYIVERGRSRRRNIETGIETADKVEVTEGLRRNDRVVVEGFETLSNNTRVREIK